MSSMDIAEYTKFSLRKRQFFNESNVSLNGFHDSIVIMNYFKCINNIKPQYLIFPCVKYNQYNILLFLLNNGGFIEDIDFSTNYTCFCKDTNILKFLIKNNIRFGIYDGKYKEKQITNNFSKTISLLMKFGIKNNSYYEKTLKSAIQNNHLNIVKIIAKYCLKTRIIYRATMDAIRYNDLSMVKYFIKIFDKIPIDKYLDYAMLFRRKSIVKYLSRYTH